MLWSIAVVFSLVWALGSLTSHTMGGFIHLLIATAVILVVVRTLQPHGALYGWRRRPKS